MKSGYKIAQELNTLFLGVLLKQTGKQIKILPILLFSAIYILVLKIVQYIAFAFKLNFYSYFIYCRFHWPSSKEME